MEHVHYRLDDQEGGRLLGFHRSSSQAGFTLIEMMVTLVLFAVLTALAIPAFSTWSRNSKIRAVAESLQTGLRLAQTESMRRNRQVVMTLTNSKVTAENVTSQIVAANGNYWSLSTVQAYTGDSPVFIESGVLSDVAANVKITGPAAICFNALGRLVANSSPGFTGAECETPSPPASPSTSPAMLAYDIGFADTLEGQDRPLRVTVALGGQVRLCDRAKSLSDHPDGCP